MLRIPRLLALAGALGVLAVGGIASTAHADGTFQLANGPTSDKNNCEGAPADVDSWHFVLVPNSGGLAFTSITLNLAGTSVSGTIVPNGGQLDNVYVPVPDGYTLTSLVKLGTSATYTGTAAENSKMNLSHVCDRTETEEEPDPTCEDDPTLEGCEIPDPTCEDNPQLEGCEIPDPTCEDDPKLEGCEPVDPCLETPGLDECEVPDPCLQNPSLEQCKEVESEPTVPTTAPPTTAAPTTAAPSTDAPTTVSDQQSEAPLPSAPVAPPSSESAAPVVPTVPGTLPVTGSSDEILILAALLSLGAGFVLVAITRRARKA